MKKDNNLKVKFLIGIQGSGKSTWANNFVRNNTNWVILNRDTFRKMLTSMWICEPNIEEMISKMINDALITCLKFKQNVIVDNTNLKDEFITPLVDLVSAYADVEFQIFDLSVDKAIERDSARDKQVGVVRIKKMFNQYKILLENFNFTHRKKKSRVFSYESGWDKNLQNAAIFDIDGTLAHMNGRRGPFDWEKVDVDSLDPHLARMVKLHKAYGDIIILLSGRDDTSENLTKQWLDFYEVPYDIILMRKAEDFRKDAIVKKEIYENHVIGKYNIVAIYDDRTQVVEALRNELGLKVFQVEAHDF